MDVWETVPAVSMDEIQFDGTKALLTDNWGQARIRLLGCRDRFDPGNQPMQQPNG
jgi:hypothetical protein